MSKNPMWSALLPIGGMVQNKAGQLVRIDRDAMVDVIAETNRYEADLRAQGRLIHRPFLKTDTPHKDSGERYGDLVDRVITRDPNDLDEECLALKFMVTDEAKGKIDAGSMTLASIQIDTHTDPQTGTEYGPMILEVSPTAKPKITNYSLTDLLTPAALDRVGLALSEGEQMDIEATLLAMQDQLTGIAASQTAFESRILALETPATGEEETAEATAGAPAEVAAPVVAPAAPAPQPATEPVAIAASEDARILALVDARFNQRVAQAALPTNEVAQPGAFNVSAAESKKKTTPPTFEVLKRKTGLTGLDAVHAHKAVVAGEATINDYVVNK